MKSRTYFRIAAVTLAVVFTGWMAVRVINAAEPQPIKKKAAVSQTVDPSDPTSIIYLDTSGKLAGTGDATKPVSASFKAGQAWHPQAMSAAVFPKDKYGLVDWAKTVKQGNIIAPRPSLDPTVEDTPPLDMDVIITAKGRFTNDVTYPHWIHTYWFNCDNCHTEIFIPAAGQNNMTMVGIVSGQWCGRCHGKVAFPLTDCSRCHNVPKAKAKK